MTADTTRTAETLSKLTQGIAELTNSDRWRNYLDAARCFHNYSFSNVLLIQSQLPTASRAAGFHTWRSLGRSVRRGERAIWILAPITKRLAVDGHASNADPKDAKQVIVSFRAVPVFDVAQTDGDPLPQVANRLAGEDPCGAFDQLRRVAATVGYSVSVEPLAGERNGDCTFAEHHIRIRDDLSPAQAVKTLCHEVGHALMHDGFAGARELAECEAESVAYVVCEGLGLDTSDYSFGYIAGWAGGGDEAIKAITVSGNRIQGAAHRMLGSLEAPALAQLTHQVAVPPRVQSST
jgi:antirestriction protein ArdC